VCEKLLSCYANYGCISFPPIPRICLANDSIVPMKQLTIKNLAEPEGQAWWIVKGLNPDYDCYICQTMQLNQVNSTLWDYKVQYEVYLRDGSLKSITQHIPIPPNSKNISFVIQYAGLKHSTTWWLLNEADDKSWIAMYYCGSSLQWNYEGAVVYARNHTLSNNSYQSISDTYKSVLGIDFSQFCDVRNPEDCPIRV